MSFTHTVRQNTSYTDSNGNVSRASTNTQVAGSELSISESITDSLSQLVAFTLDVSQCKSFAIWSVGGNMTVGTNDTITPDNVFDLVDGKPIIWSAGMVDSPTNPVTTDIIALYVTNTGEARLEIRALFDPTA